MSESDAVLVERTRSGDAVAFEGLVRRYLRPAYAVALGVVHEPADAEDVCQDAFVTALEHIEDCRQPDRFAAWFLRIVRNRAHSVRRYLSVRDAAPLDAVPVQGHADPEHDVERAELRARLLDALDDLTDVQREVLLLHDLEGWKHREIAERLGLPEGTVRAHLFYARKAVRSRKADGFRTEDTNGA
jgi:RNA polymerase sigma-70 factor (ECF subfamily)